MTLLRKWTAIGLPYRGLRLGNTLTLEDGHVLDVTGVTEIPSNGDTWLYKAPTPPGITRTTEQAAADTARHWTWKEYEIWLRFTNADREWVYVDPAGTHWWMRYDWARSGNNFSITVRLLGRYGVYKINLPADPATNINCGSGSFSGSRTSVPAAAQLDYLDFASDDNLTPIGRVMPSPDGAKAIINVGHGGSASTSTGASYTSTITDIIDVQISGTGSLDPATFGQGVSASVTKIKDGAALFPMYTGWQYGTTTISSGTCCCGTPAAPTGYPGSNTATGPRQTEGSAEYHWDWYQMHWYDTAGTLRWIRDRQDYEETESDTYTYSLTAEWVGEIGDAIWTLTSSTHSASRTKSVTMSRTVDIGEETITFGYTASHTGDITGTGDPTLDTDCTVTLPEPDAAKIATFQTQYNNAAGVASADELGSVARSFNNSGSLIFLIQTNNDYQIVGYSGGKVVVNDPTRTVKASYHPVTKVIEYTVAGLQPQWI